MKNEAAVTPGSRARRAALALCAAASLAALAPLGSSAVEVDGIAATVGSSSILRSEVLGQMRRRGITDESRYGEVRNELIDRALILKAAGDAKMKLQDWVVDDRVQTIIDEAFDGDRNKLVEALRRDGIAEPDWRNRIRDDMVVNAMRWNEVYRFVRATPAMMRAEYEAHPERYGAGQRTTVSVILLAPEDSAKRAEVVEAIAKDGFAAAARAHSADSRAAQGGVWKDVSPEEEFSPAVCAAIADLEVGATSDWIDMDGWSFLVRKDAESEKRLKPFAEAYPDVEARVRGEEAARLEKAWLDRLRAETYVKTY